VPPVRDESARAPKHPDTSQRKGLASSHFRRGFPRSPYSGIGSARWPPRRSSLDPPPADPAPAGILDVGGQLPEFGCPSPEFAGVHWPARSKPAGLGAGGRHCCTASTAPDVARMPDLSAFEVLLAIARTGSLGAAGREVGFAKIELARHALRLDPETLNPARLAIQDRHNFTLPPTPVVRVEEAVSEKLARYRRVSLARDLYDLHWFATSGVFDEALTRRLWVLKVYRDLVVDGRGTKPVDPNDILRPRDTRDFKGEDIGYLTRPVRLNEWIATVRSRYAFIAQLDEDERRWAACNERDLYEVNQALASFRPARDHTVE
jgi:Nucleotidyl transferase AbiEii toxin, Type IV TA system